jgi:hypothetical protein
MPAEDPALYQALADALATGISVSEALALIARISGAPATFARRWVGASDDAGLAAAASRAGLATSKEAAQLRASQSRPELVATLRAMALRRRVRVDRRAAVREGLSAPVVLLMLSAVLDPIASVVAGGSYFAAFFRGLVAVGVVVGLGTVVGPAALADPRLGPKILGALAHLSPTRVLVAQHTESEIALALAPIATSLDLDARAVDAIADATPWTRRAPSVDPIASLPTGVALALLPAPSSSVDARLLAHAANSASIATARARSVVRWSAYAVVAIVGLRSIVGILGGHLTPGLGGLSVSPEEQKELEEIDRQIHTPIVQPSATPRAP